MRPIFYFIRFRRSKLVLIIGGLIALAVLIILIVTVIKPKADILMQGETSHLYPSARYAATGTFAGNTDSYTWEANHVDFTMAANTASLVVHKQLNPGMPNYGYTVLRYINPVVDNAVTEGTLTYLQDYADSHAVNIEDMFIHFSENTVLAVDSSGSGFSGDRFFNVLYYNTSYYQHKNDWGAGDAAFTFGTKTGEILNFGQYNKFDEINFKFTTPASGSFAGVWEYWDGSNWSSLTVTDTSNTLHQDGRVSFVPPTNWVRGLVNNNKLFWVRFRLTQIGTACQFAASKGIRAAEYMQLVDATNKYYQIPGWDEAADTNHDGFLNAAEWANHASGKSARFKWWSRMLGRNSVDPLSWQTNAGGTLFREAMAARVVSEATKSYSGYTYDGIMFDDFLGGFNYWLYASFAPSNLNPISGGSVYEYSKPGLPDRSIANRAYDADIVGALSYIANQMHAVGKKVAINSPRWPDAEAVVDVSEMEREFFSDFSFSKLTSLSDYYGISTWLMSNHSAGITSILQHQVNLSSWVTDADVRDRDNYLGLATFYLVQNPGLDYFAQWYGSYYTSPDQSKYFPPAISADIGQPSGTIPTGYSAVTGLDSNMFLFAQGTDPASGKPYKIAARDYSKGLVLVKPKADFASNVAATFGDNSKTTHDLPVTSDNPSGRYFLVGYDGTVSGTAITSITLRNAEGAILIKESAMTGVSLSKSVSKSSAASGETITYTINYQVGNTAVTSAKIEDPIPSGTSFVSAANGGISNGTTITWNLGNLAIGAKGSVSFQVKIK